MEHLEARREHSREGAAALFGSTRLATAETSGGIDPRFELARAGWLVPMVEAFLDEDAR